MASEANETSSSRNHAVGPQRPAEWRPAQGSDVTLDAGEIVFAPEMIEAGAQAFPVTVWTNYRHAPGWFADAMKEARQSDHDARRREIVFAACLADSYLAEWVIVDVVNRDFVASRDYLPADDRRGVTDRWKKIPSKLVRDGRIPAPPDLGGTHAKEWLRLISYRDGLVHANASRPETSGLPDEWLPVPSKAGLDALKPGWALGVVVERIRRLHRAVGTAPPEWLADPP